jgi:Na+/H+ antiporter NhaD/arsenite permease-like protein
MLSKSIVAGFPDPHAGWTALARASTLAGNLTITGSVAIIIVVEGARTGGVRTAFRDYARAGVPGSLATLVFGTLWVWTTH